MAEYVVDDIFFGDGNQPVFNDSDVYNGQDELAELEETVSNELKNYLRLSGGMMTGPLQFSDSTSQSSAFTNELKTSVLNTIDKTDYISISRGHLATIFATNIRLFEPYKIIFDNGNQTKAYSDDDYNMNHSNSLKLTDLTYDDGLMKTSVSNNFYAQNLTAGNINTSHLSGTTSNLQQQINNLSSGGGNSGNYTGSINATQIADGTVSNTEFQYLNGVTSSIQTQLNNLVTATDSIDATKIANGSISNTEFQYLNGATSNIQQQITNIRTPSIVVLDFDRNELLGYDSNYLPSQTTISGNATFAKEDILHLSNRDGLSTQVAQETNGNFNFFSSYKFDGGSLYTIKIQFYLQDIDVLYKFLPKIRLYKGTAIYKQSLNCGISNSTGVTTALREKITTGFEMSMTFDADTESYSFDVLTSYNLETSTTSKIVTKMEIVQYHKP